VDKVSALLLEIDPLFADSTDEQNERIEKVVEIPAVGFAIANVGAVVPPDDID